MIRLDANPSRDTMFDKMLLLNKTVIIPYRNNKDKIVASQKLFTSFPCMYLFLASRAGLQVIGLVGLFRVTINRHLLLITIR